MRSPVDVELPEQFRELTPFVGEWGGLDTQDERYRQRQKLPMARLAAYYEAVCPRLDAIFSHLEGFPYGATLPPAESLLLRVVMAMSEVAQAFEIFGQPGVPGAAADHSAPVIVLTRA